MLHFMEVAACYEAKGRKTTDIAGARLVRDVTKRLNAHLKKRREREERFECVVLSAHVAQVYYRLKARQRSMTPTQLTTALERTVKMVAITGMTPAGEVRAAKRLMITPREMKRLHGPVAAAASRVGYALGFDGKTVFNRINEALKVLGWPRSRIFPGSVRLRAPLPRDLRFSAPTAFDRRARGRELRTYISALIAYGEANRLVQRSPIYPTGKNPGNAPRRNRSKSTNEHRASG